MKKGMDRRSFLRSTVAVGAGLVLAPKSFGLTTGSKTDDINVALLGAGAQGQVLMSCCLKIPGIRFKAVCDIWTAYNQRRVSRTLKAYHHEHNTYLDYQEMRNPRYIHCYNKLLKDAKILGRITAINGQWNRAARPDLGWPKKYPIDQATLEKYGFQSMHQFRNWRWYKGLGGGPIVDLGSHQIDVFNWFLNTQPKSAMASGGTDYYDKKTHEWYDTVMAVYEYETKEGTVRAFYQTITTNSSQGYFETFMGDQGTLFISEAAGRGGVYREPSAPDWDKWVKMGYLNEPARKEEKLPTGAVLDVRETVAPPSYKLPVKFNDPYHKPHLENFFGAIRGRAKLNCPAEIGYETAVTVLKVNEAVEAARKLTFKPEEFKV